MLQKKDNKQCKEEEDHKCHLFPPWGSKHIHKGANKLLSICFFIITPIS